MNYMMSPHIQANCRLREEDVSESNLEEGEVSGQVWKAYQAQQNKHVNNDLFKMRLELAEAQTTEFICHEDRQSEVHVTAATRAARVIAQTSESQDAPTSELVDMVAKSIKTEKVENENSPAPTIPGAPPGQCSDDQQLSQELAAIWEEAFPPINTVR